MTLGAALLRSYRDLQQSWVRLADSAFGRAVPKSHDEMARGEFISAFICEPEFGPSRAAEHRKPSH